MKVQSHNNHIILASDQLSDTLVVAPNEERYANNVVEDDVITRAASVTTHVALHEQ